MINLVRRVRINDRIPAMWYNDKLIRTAYRKETLIVGEYEYDPNPSPYAVKYFAIESLEDNNTITFTKGEYAPNNTYYTSTDLNTWTEYYGTQSWTLNTGQKLYFKSTAHLWYDGNIDVGNVGWKPRGWRFYSTNLCNISGNIMSLFYGDEFAGKTVFPSSSPYTLHSFFREFDKLFDSKYLVLPANARASGTYIINGLPPLCYMYMFEGCTSLVNAPLLLPADILSDRCYCEMFSGCTSLITAPSISATTVENNCCYRMFYGCTSLVNAPAILPATTLANACYANMFEGCTSLVTAPALPATTLDTTCYAYMFRGCTSLVNAPELPATTLQNYCYQYMFYNCNKLNYIKCLATDISAYRCILVWLANVAASGTFVKAASMNSWPTGASGIPSGWTVQDAA